MIDVDKLVQKEIERGEDLKKRIKEYKTSCPAILAVLNSHEMTAYKYFKVDLDDLQSVDSFCYYMHHAMVDDGDYSVVRTVDESATGMRTRIHTKLIEKGKPSFYAEDELTVYRYSIEGGDWDSKERPAALLDQADIMEICELDELHYNYYEKHMEEIEDFNSPWENPHRQEYFKLAQLADKHLEKIWKENYERNKAWYESAD